ncbi:MAG TPA: DUF5522 domain-containing protein [Candidatus Sumerlaeota bacterium]|nr:DUF5522 domain-containing protein [Candidatus Sumerlaeota bacterium]
MARLKEGQDYYRDQNGLLVFTADYLRRRGFCCHCGCRNCPYPETEALPTSATAVAAESPVSVK